MVVMVEMVVLALLVTETADRLILVVENIARHFQTGVRSTKDGQTVFTSKWVRRGTFIVVARGCVSGGTAFDRGLLFLIREREREFYFLLIGRNFEADAMFCSLETLFLKGAIFYLDL